MVAQLKTRDELKNLVKKHNDVIIKFKAEWCGPCKRISPYVSELMDHYKKITYAEVDVDEGSNIASYLKIRSIPTMVSYIDGDIHEILSSSSAEDISKFFEKTNSYVKK